LFSHRAIHPKLTTLTTFHQITLRCLSILSTFVFFGQLYAQDSISSNSSFAVPSKFFTQVNKSSSQLQQKLDRKTAKALSSFEKKEKKINVKLVRIDSLAAKNIFADADKRYAELKNKLSNTDKITQYIPHLDSLSTSLKFLEQSNGLLSNAGDAKAKLEKSLASVRELETKFQQAEDLRKFLKERKEYLKQQLEKFGFAKQLKKMNKQVYYYSEQLKEYKATLHDPKKIEKKVLDLLSKTKLFKDFMRRNSMLASLFRMPGADITDPAYQASLAGLQTRSQVNGLIQQQVASGGPNAQAQFQQNLQQAQSKLNELKSKMLKYGNGSSDDEMPDFKPNGQKTRSFLQRLEYGTNMQTQRSNNLFPVTSDLGLSVGYKMNDKSIIGIGAAYKLGWGHNFRSIRLTQEGAGLRSFVDWKIKGSFWISGGYEMNYKTAFNSIDQLKTLNAWQQSGLLGVSKKVSLKTKFFKNTKLQLLWDFLSYRQVPRTQPIVFRVGYSLK
jgi:hypothetical protein